MNFEFSEVDVDSTDSSELHEDKSEESAKELE